MYCAKKEGEASVLKQLISDNLCVIGQLTKMQSLLTTYFIPVGSILIVLGAENEMLEHWKRVWECFWSPACKP